MNQLKTRFGDVKFAGIAVEDSNIEQSEKLVDIFVMPDVVEEVRARSFEQELLLEKTVVVRKNCCANNSNGRS